MRLDHEGNIVITLDGISQEEYSKLTCSLITLIQQRNKEFVQDTESLYYVLSLLKSLQINMESILKKEIQEL